MDGFHRPTLMVVVVVLVVAFIGYHLLTHRSKAA